MTRREPVPMKSYTIRYSGNEALEHCPIREPSDEFAVSFTQGVANRTGCPMELFETIEGLNFHVSRVVPSHAAG